MHTKTSNVAEQRQTMRRFTVALVACVGLLALALSAAPAGAAADPAAPAGAATGELTKVSQNRAAAWECPAGHSCYYDQLGGNGSYWVAPSCGLWDLRGSWLQDNLFSINNRGNGVVSVYNWNGNGFELKGWVQPGNPGNFHQNVGADAVYINC